MILLKFSALTWHPVIVLGYSSKADPGHSGCYVAFPTSVALCTKCILQYHLFLSHNVIFSSEKLSWKPSPQRGLPDSLSRAAPSMPPQLCPSFYSHLAIGQLDRCILVHILQSLNPLHPLRKGTNQMLNQKINEQKMGPIKNPWQPFIPWNGFTTVCIPQDSHVRTVTPKVIC